MENVYLKGNMLWLVSITLAFLLIIFVKRNVPVYSPAAIFTFFWCIQIIIILLLFSHILFFKYWGIIYILIAISVYDVGYIVTGSIYKTKCVTQGTIHLNYNACKRIYLAMLILSFINVALSIKSYGFSFSSIFDFQSILDISHQNSVDRYSGEKASSITRILSINSSATSIVGGLLLFSFKRKKKILCYLSILPPIVIGLAEGAKMGIITSIFLFLSGALVGSQLLNIPIKINTKKIIYGIIIFILFLALMVLTMMFRIGRFNIDTMFIVFGRATSYILAHLPAFDLWFSNHEESIFNLTMGGKTFFGITNSLGILERKQGLYETMMQVSDDGSMTNVYSYFRVVIDDFGMFGSLIYMFLIGSLSRIIYDNFIQKHNIYLSSTLLSGIYFFISWSFGTSVFVYTTYVAMMVYLYLILRIILVNNRNNIRISSIREDRNRTSSHDLNENT